MTSEAPPRAGLILATLILGAAVANLNLSVANVALPTIGRDLDAPQTALNLVAVGFILGLAASVLYLGAVADRYGRRRMLIGGLALSIVAAGIAATAPTVEVLAAARIFGGIAAGMAFPTTLSIISDLFRGSAKTRAIALWAGIGGGASALGPAVAGYLLQNHGWGSAFALTIPIAAIALVLVVIVIPHHTGEDNRAVDHLGGVLSVLAVGSLTLGLHFVTIPGSFALGFGLMLGSILGFAVFAWRQLRAPNPLFDLKIAARRTFWVAGVGGIIVFGSLVGTMFIGQQYLQNVLGYSTFAAGVAALPAAVTMIAVSPFAARSIERYGSRLTMTAGFVAVLAGVLLMFTWREGASYLPVGVAFAVIGIGIGLAGSPASRSIMAAVPARRAGMGSAMTDLQRDLGAAIMQSLLAAFLTVKYSASIESKLAHLPAQQRAQISESTAAVLQNSFGGADVLAQQYPAHGTAIIAAARDAFLQGSALAVVVASITVGIGLVLVWFAFPRHAEELAAEAEYAREQ